MPSAAADWGYVNCHLRPSEASRTYGRKFEMSNIRARPPKNASNAPAQRGLQTDVALTAANGRQRQVGSG